MSSGGPFNTVGGLRPRRNFFNLSHSKLFDCHFGQLYPIVALEVVPGDKFKIGNNIVVRTQPLKSPLMQNIKVFVEYFFVPYRILWDDFGDFIHDNKDGTWTGEIPLFNDLKQADVKDNYSLGSLADAFGFPVGVDVPFEDAPNALRQMAYNRIFNEYYRDETIDDEIGEFNNDLLYRRRRKDYFTSALPFQQRGVAPAFSWNLGGQNIDVVTDKSIHLPSYFNVHDDSFALDGYLSLSDNPVNYTTGQFSRRDPVTNELISGTDGAVNINAYTSSGAGSPGARRAIWRHYSTSSGLTEYYGLESRLPSGVNLGKVSLPDSTIGFTISELRQNIQVQKWLERSARSGCRMTEFLLAHFGISPRDSVLQRPEYIGGLRGNLSVNEVLQTSESTGSSAQGNMAGRGVGVISDYVGTYTASEFGCIMGLFSVIPREIYDSQGLSKDWTRRDRFDFYFPEFAHLSEQPILNREIFMTADHSKVVDDVEVGNIGTFGYQPIYTEYRHERDKVCGKFRVHDGSVGGGALQYWTMARSFTETPTLSSDFLEADYVNEENRIFPLNKDTPLMVACGNVLKGFRPIPKLGEPGLVDHF